MKRNSIIAIAFLLSLAQFGCGPRDSERQDQIKVQAQQKQYAAAQPIPAFEFSQERDMAIQLYKMRNEQHRTWTVWRSDMGMIEGDCESIGFPLPYDVQLTNPLQVQRLDTNSTLAGVIEQPEPNGLFTSKHTTATWVRSVVRHGDRVVEVPLYIEGKVTCYPYPILVDYEKNRVKRAETELPTIKFEKKGP